jgi:hypothetical protein
MRSLIILLGICFSTGLFAQGDVTDTSLSIPMFYATYTYQFPGGDLKDRFGNNSAIGGGFLWKTNQNWLWGAEYLYLFGGDVKIEDQILTNLKTEDGTIINMAGNFTNFSIYERGYYLSGRIGKVIPLLNANPNSGIFATYSLGYFQHKIRIEVDQNSAPQLVDDYKRGYDRLTGGFCMSEFVGYLFLSKSRLLNLSAGVEFSQAWTRPMRDINFDTGEPDKVQKRFDPLTGIKIAWIIPLFKRLPEKFYYY